MTHIEYMQLALTLAKRGNTSPNPMVGAVVVKDGEIVGRGYHKKAGMPHAEIEALADAGDNAKNSVMYVTLEPCSHWGRTPPCTKAIIESGIKEVYAAMVDPDSRVAGNGLAELEKAGVKVHYPLCEAGAKKLNECYIKHRTTGLPFVILKSAMSLDGKIATGSGDSKWITCQKSREYAHKIRSKVDAVLVGANTARIDDPKLTSRTKQMVTYPARVVLTKSGNLNDDLNIFNQPGKVFVATSKNIDFEKLRKLEASGVRILTVEELNGRLSIADLMMQLGKEDILSVLIEGGGDLAASALNEKIVDKILYFYAPIIVGGSDSVSSVQGKSVDKIASAWKIEKMKIKKIDTDFAIEGYLKYQ